MGLSLRMLLVDRSDRIHRFGIAKFDEMRRNPAQHRYPQFAGQRVRTVEAVVELVDRKPTRVVRITFDIFTFDDAGCFDSETFERQQFGRFELGVLADGRELTAEPDAGANVVDATIHFAARGGRWAPQKALARALRDAALDRLKCPRL
jgi:hypothetical protein